jgi:hypothetical protein
MTMKKQLIFMIFVTMNVWALAQNPKLGVVSFDANQNELKPEELTELLRIEISKHGKYELVDRYEIKEALSKANIDPKTCLSKSCLMEAGKILDVDYLMSASVDKLGEALFIRIRLLNLQNASVEKEIVKEFLNIPQKLNTMISICVNEMNGVENDKVIVNSLSNKESYESAINNPYYQRLNLSGPRMGYTFFTGQTASALKAPESQGGYDALPAFFQMGYQFEVQYLSEGKWQALFEFIPLVSGMDQGLFIPSVTLLNGIRSNKNGLEFAIGPSFNVVKKTDKYYFDGKWHRPTDRPNTEGNPLEKKLDSRGSYNFASYVVIAAGYSFRSGKLNIPVNAFFVPSKDDMRIGISFGFNIRNK